MRNIYRLTLSKFFSSLYFAIVIQTIFLFQRGLSFAQIMWLESILLAGILLFEVPTGILGDRIGRKKSLILGAVVSLVAWIPWFLAESFFLFALSYFISGIAIAFNSGSDQALIYDDLKSSGEENKMQKFYGIFGAAILFADAIAGLIGGYIASAHTLQAFYLIYKLIVIMEIIGLFILFSVKEAPVTKEGEEQARRPEEKIRFFRDGLRLIKENKKFRKIFLLSVFSAPFSIMLVYVFQPYFKLARVPNEYFGLAVFISSLFAVGTKLLAHKIEIRFGAERGMLIVTLSPAILWALMALTFHPLLAIVLFILNTGFGNIKNPVFSGYLNRHIPSYNRATVLSTISFIGVLYQLIMRPILGYLIDLNLQYAFIITALIIGLGSMVFRAKKEYLQVG